MERSLKDLISKLPIPGLKESTDRNTIAQAITTLLNIPIKPHQIILKDEIITVSVPPVVKSALHIKQQELLTLLNKEGVSAKTVR